MTGVKTINGVSVRLVESVFAVEEAGILGALIGGVVLAQTLYYSMRFVVPNMAWKAVARASAVRNLVIAISFQIICTRIGFMIGGLASQASNHSIVKTVDFVAIGILLLPFVGFGRVCSATWSLSAARAAVAAVFCFLAQLVIYLGFESFIFH